MIRVNPEQLTQAGNQFKRAGGETQSAMAALEASVNGLMVEWEGHSAQRFFQEYQQWHKSMHSLVQLLDTTANQLFGIAESYRQADRH